MYAKIEQILSGRFWENELLNFLKLKFIFFKFKILQKRKKGLTIFTQGIFSPNLKKIRKSVAELQVLTDGRTDRPTDRRRAMAIGPVDLKMHYLPPDPKS